MGPVVLKEKREALFTAQTREKINFLEYSSRMGSLNQNQSQTSEGSKTARPQGFLNPDVLQSLSQTSLFHTLEKITNVEKLTLTNFPEWESSILIAFNARDLDCFLDPKWTASLPEDSALE
ncbi:hypothetical protein O181_078186 [Austropuccinia psidii MF-1]|uniref:Uncharacterized protein n=1 Tax=Austropuccinia psidii MF-1 TaxID=1389203 RepID=A0A9Q3FDT7_9BASI|nr:hypothetical protein [Austropuccinia psidii MF-1]